MKALLLPTKTYCLNGRLWLETDDGRFLGGREDRRGGFGAAHGLFRARALAPFGHRFGVDAEALG